MAGCGQLGSTTDGVTLLMVIKWDTGIPDSEKNDSDYFIGQNSFGEKKGKDNNL